MKKQHILLIILCSVIFLSCSQDKYPIPDFTKADMAISENYGEIVILNKSKKAQYYTISFFGGTSNNQNIQGSIKDTLAKFTVNRNGNYTIYLSVWNNLGGIDESISRKDTTITVTSIPPVIDWNLKYLGNGKVQVEDRSKYTNTAYTLSSLCGYFIEFDLSPLLHFDRNGTYEIKAYNQTKTIEINDLPDEEPLQLFTGSIFGKQETISLNSYNDFYCSYGLLALTNTPVVKFETEDFRLLMLNMVSFYPPQVEYHGPRLDEKYAYFKRIFTPGPVNSKEWYPLVYLNGQFLTFKNFLDNPINSIEIIEVKEVTVNKLVPRMLDKAFWVTFKIKGTIEGKGLINGTLKVRYHIY